MQHIYSELIELNRAFGHLQGDVRATRADVVEVKKHLGRNTGRLDRIEREVRIVRTRKPRGLMEWWPALSGLLALALAAAGKIEWGQALALLRGAGG